MKTTKSLILIFTSILMLPSCVTTEYFETKQLIEPSPLLLEAMATEIIVTLKNQTPPAKTTLTFTHKKESLAQLLEKKFRDEGYAIAMKGSSPASKPITFAYTLDSGNKRQIFLRFVFGESFQATRIYELSESGSYRAQGPLLMRRVEP